jgi:hypothetical protein
MKQWPPDTRQDTAVQPPLVEPLPGGVEPPTRRRGRLVAVVVMAAVLVVAGLTFVVVKVLGAPTENYARAAHPAGVSAGGPTGDLARTPAQSMPPAIDPRLGAGPTDHTVTYSVTSTSPTVSLSWTTPTNSRQATVSAPWTETETGDFAFESVVASMTTPGGTIDCSIAVDGVVVAQQSNTAPLTVVSCFGQ